MMQSPTATRRNPSGTLVVSSCASGRCGSNFEESLMPGSAVCAYEVQATKAKSRNFRERIISRESYTYCPLQFVYASGTGSSRRLPWPAEEQGVSIRITKFESAKAIMGVLERHAEACSMVCEFRGQRVGVGRIDESIPPQVGMTFGVRHWRDALL